MTQEEAVRIAQGLITDFKCESDTMVDFCNTVIKALKQGSEAEQFAKWVASAIFDDDWEYNQDAFEELACRKLVKLGIVKLKGDEYELAEESEDK